MAGCVVTVHRISIYFILNGLLFYSCGPLLAQDLAWTVICVRRAKAAAGGLQAAMAANAHVTDRSSRSKDKLGPD